MAEPSIADEGRSAASTNTKRDRDSANGGTTGPTMSEKDSRFRTLELVDRYIDEPRKLRVVVIGAGIAGVVAGVLLPAKVPDIELTILEKNADVGGTWFENIYPGVRCDIPAHVYQSSFEPNSQWSEEFAQGAEILAYWQHVARKHRVYELLKLAHRVDSLDWDDAHGAWTVGVTDLSSSNSNDAETKSTLTLTADFVITASGRFNAWQLPDYPGMSEFQGLLRHASNWDPNFDPAGKRVAVIGNGASGIQLVANLSPVVAHLDHYARSRTWVAASFAGDATSTIPKPFPPDLLDSFRKDPRAYTRWRKGVEDKYWRGAESWLRDSERNESDRAGFVEYMRSHLVIARKPELLKELVPDFSPHCRRLTPGPGYLEAITKANCDYVQMGIRRFTKNGIETVDGRLREVDAVFCATGANVDMVQRFPVRARGRELGGLWGKGGELGFPYTYLGAATPGFPNLLFLHGPNASGRSGSVPHAIESQITFFAKILRKASREGIRAMQPSTNAADDFVEYCDTFFKTTVLSENCSSWYNSATPGGRIHGLWPGSGAHLGIIQREPRWEDWEYEYLDEGGEGEGGGKTNRFMWYFGRGATRKEQDGDADMTPYLKDLEDIDLRALHEGWWDIP
ncbi:Uu.00g012310.m01.CDS01 [Anthostomella pinea]|uniref:Uu.00g012310.m01.CDS01 n=1 Tax=Anthostomella pinea TaxID=933095 RepID=A0AAI8YMW3_9PEZI|nr:Uu.00g012310.m01.CDS01 [Anthostomella pinea]